METKNKRYIQACEAGGSIYGRRSSYSLHDNKVKGTADQGVSSSLSSYRDFYKKQADAMEKIFRRGQ